MNLKPLLQRIIQEFNRIKDHDRDTFGIIYTSFVATFFFVGGILGILNNFMIKMLLFLALGFLLVYCIMIMDKNKNHPS